MANVEISRISVQIPVMLAGRRGCIRAAVIKGAAPLLISRMALKNLNASIDFGQDCLTVFEDRQVPLIINEAGQYMVNLLEPPCTQEAGNSTFAEVICPSLILPAHVHPLTVTKRWHAIQQRH